MGENDLISRSALLSGFDVRKVTEYDESGCGVDYKAVPVKAIEDAPTIDAVPVVRCKNCRHWDRTRRTPSSSHFCFCTMMHTAENHYCGHGRKMDGEIECSDG